MDEDFCRDSALRKLLNGYPFAYLSDTILNSSQKLLMDTLLRSKRFSICPGLEPYTIHNPSLQTGKIELKYFSPNYFSFETESNVKSFFTIFQQYNHNWKVSINGKASTIYKTNIAFMGTPVPTGKSKIEFLYKPSGVIIAIYFSVLTILLLLSFYIYRYTRRKENSN